MEFDRRHYLGYNNSLNSLYGRYDNDDLIKIDELRRIVNVKLWSLINIVM